MIEERRVDDPWKKDVNETLQKHNDYLTTIQLDLNQMRPIMEETKAIIKSGEAFFKMIGHVTKGIKWIAGILAAIATVVISWKVIVSDWFNGGL